MKKVIVAGGRDFVDQVRCDQVLKCSFPNEDIIVISGCANGADRCGESTAEYYGWDVIKFPAEWDKYGNAAGHLRNKEMAENGTHLIAFWDGESRGTLNMIETATNLDLVVEVKRY